jgi:hypothetical protein
VTTSQPDSLAAAVSACWCSYFRSNTWNPDDLIPDSAAPHQLTAEELPVVARSIQQFQLGEGSQGRRLLNRGRAYADATGDTQFPEALTLFIREEQRHSATLLRFMEQQGIPPLPSHWVDRVFRRVRLLAGLELCLRVLAAAEIIAVPYYRALSRASASPVLRAICHRVLKDEAMHLQYQASMMSRIEAGRSNILRFAVWRAHRLFLLGTCVVVWSQHGPVFRAAGYTFHRFILETLSDFHALECRACGIAVQRLVFRDSVT